MIASDEPAEIEITSLAGVRTVRSKLIDLLRHGGTALAVALVINGVADYMFLSVTGRALGPRLFTQVSVLWATLFLVGNGLYIPLEQELGRSISARRARGTGYGSLFRRVAIVTGVSFVVITFAAS